jgi:hypothetical protein
MDLRPRIGPAIERLRDRGHGGTRIRQHRSLYHIKLQPADLSIALLLPIVFNVLLFLGLDHLMVLWRSLMEFWLERIMPAAAVGSGAIDLGNYVLAIPVPALTAGAPGGGIWWGTLVACAVLLAATFFIPPRRFLPLTYAVRACLAIQATALVFFYFWPNRFPYDLPTYLTDAMGMALLLMFIAPWLLGLTYDIFDFPLLQKVTLTALVMAFFAVALPLQYLLHAVLLHAGSLLFLPLCYLVFGVFVDVMVFVAFYAWGMSWRFALRGRDD